MKTLDVRTLACPGPVLALRDMLNAGERAIQLQVADELARSNVTRFAVSRGAEVSSEADPDGGFSVTIHASDTSHGARPGEEELLTCELPAAGGPTVVQINAETMGAGDDELGSVLMRSFIKTQAQLPTLPELMVFYNGGVRLCCNGSSLLDDLAELATKGVEIIVCGTCLNYYELAAELAVGRVTDMLEIATRLAGAGRIVRP